MEAAILSIQKQFGTQLHNIICKKVGHEDHCHDIMQEVYLKIMLQLPKIEKAANMAAYLVQITNNTITDHFRKGKAAGVKELSDDATIETERQYEQSLQLADCCLRPLIEALPAIYRDALVMTELDGMKYREYAAKAGISLSNAKVRVQRAKEKLKEMIMECCNYEFDSYGNIVDCQQQAQPGCCKK